MDTKHLTAFVAAAEAGSVSLAAQRLGRQISSISRSISQLETELGAELLERTGRGVRLTAAGEQVLERSRTALRELELARSELKAASGSDPTTLRVSTPPDLAHQLMPDVVVALVTEFPSLKLDVRGESRRVSAVEESWDALVRLGAPGTSDLLPRRLGQISLGLYGAPGTRVDGLFEGRCEFVLVEGVPTETTVRVRGRARPLHVRGRVRVSTFLEAARIAARGERLIVMPSVSVVQHLEAGHLVAVAPHVTFNPVDATLLRLPRHRKSALLQRLGDLLTEALADVERRVRARTGSR